LFERQLALVRFALVCNRPVGWLVGWLADWQ
jgi:hypothetical protein